MFLCSHLEIEPVIIIDIICIFSFLSCVVCSHSQENASFVLMQRVFVAILLSKWAIKEVWRFVKVGLKIPEIWQHLEVSHRFWHLLQAQSLFFKCCVFKRQRHSNVKWIVQADDQGHGSLDNWRSLLTFHIQGGCGKSSTGQIIAHILLGMEQLAEISTLQRGSWDRSGTRKVEEL